MHSLIFKFKVSPDITAGSLLKVTLDVGVDKHTIEKKLQTELSIVAITDYF